MFVPGGVLSRATPSSLLRAVAPSAHPRALPAGREFTVFTKGSAQFGVETHLALERVFNKSLEATQQFLSFETKWERWQTHWWYAPAPTEVQDKVRAVAVDTYTRAGCNGYCRFDMREDARSGRIYAVDVNVNCSLDVDDETALQIILGAEKTPFPELLRSLFLFAFRRREADRLLAQRLVCKCHAKPGVAVQSGPAPHAVEAQPPKARNLESSD